MDRPGDQGLAGSAFPGDQDRRLGVGDVVDHVERLLHSMIVANDAVPAKTFIELGFQLFVFFE